MTSSWLIVRVEEGGACVAFQSMRRRRASSVFDWRDALPWIDDLGYRFVRLGEGEVTAYVYPSPSRDGKGRAGGQLQRLVVEPKVTS